MKCKHYCFFGDAVQSKMKSNALECENWELLREEGDENFSIERSVDEYRKNCLKATAYAQSAQLIKGLLTKHKIDRAASMGIGKGVLEWHLKQCMPDLYLIGTDYTKGALQLLRNVFVECDELKTFDMLRDSYRGGGKRRLSHPVPGFYGI